MSTKFRNPFANPNHPLDYRDGKLIYARDAPDLPEKPITEPDTPPADETTTGTTRRRTGRTLYKGLQWEQPAYRENGQPDKTLLTYDKSLERLRAAGFERHPLPAEVFSLLADGLEGKLGAAEKVIAEDMLISYGEWLSAAVLVEERKTGGVFGVGASVSRVLTVYLRPEGLIWNGSNYVQKNFKYADKREYDITSIPLQQGVDLNRFPASFIEDMYSRSFDALPQGMREGDRRAQVYLPAVGQIWPVGRYNFGSRFSIGYFYGDGASRGVVVVGAKKSP